MKININYVTSYFYKLNFCSVILVLWTSEEKRERFNLGGGNIINKKGRRIKLAFIEYLLCAGCWTSLFIHIVSSHLVHLVFH